MRAASRLTRPAKAAIAFAAVVSLGFAGAVSYSVIRTSEAAPWIRVVTTTELDQRRAVKVPEHDLYVVSYLRRYYAVEAVAVRADKPAERLRYCRSSGWFEGTRSGSKFDLLGRWKVGDAKQSLRTFAVLVRDGAVYVIPRAPVDVDRRTPPPQEKHGPNC